MVKLDLTDDRPITPEKVAEVRAAFDMERREGDRRSKGRMHPGRRAIDRMAATPAEVTRLSSRGLDILDFRDCEGDYEED